MKLEGSAALVTGASRGLGAAIARLLARHGAKVGLVARHPTQLSCVAEDIRRLGGYAVPLVADLSDRLAVHPLAGQAAALLGPIDLLIHNASSLGPVPLRPLLDTDCEDLELALATNLVGPFRLSKIVAGAMAVRGQGLVLHISSDAAVNAYANWGAYGASKAAADHLARIWAAELEPFGVRFLSVDPGEMATRMHADALPEADPSTLASPDAVADAIVQLLGRSDSLATGTRLEVAS